MLYNMYVATKSEELCEPSLKSTTSMILYLLKDYTCIVKYFTNSTEHSRNVRGQYPALKILNVTNQKMMGMKLYLLIKVIINNRATFTLIHFILR